jgi:hypothetical protein
MDLRRTRRQEPTRNRPHQPRSIFSTQLPSSPKTRAETAGRHLLQRFVRQRVTEPSFSIGSGRLSICEYLIKVSVEGHGWSLTEAMAPGLPRVVLQPDKKVHQSTTEIRTSQRARRVQRLLRALALESIRRDLTLLCGCRKYRRKFALEGAHRENSTIRRRQDRGYQKRR